MVVGAVVTFCGAYWTINEGINSCHVDPANYKLGLAMYVSYFCLFAVLFYNLYLGGVPPSYQNPYLGCR